MQLITAVTLTKIALKKNTLVTLLKNECTKKAWIAALNQKEDISVQSQLTNVKSTLRRAHVLVLLYTVNTQRMQILMGTLVWAD